MKKIIFVIFTISLTQHLAEAQHLRYDDIKASEDKIRIEAAKLLITVNGKEYLYTEFPRLRDSLLKLLFASKIPRRTPRYFENYYQSDGLFREIATEIDALPENREAFYSNATRLLLKMGNLRDPFSYEVASRYLMEHFQRFRDSSMNEFIVTFALNYPFSRRSLPNTPQDSAEYCLKLGDLLQPQSIEISAYLYSMAFDCYHSLKNYSKLAELESRFGRIYSLHGGKAHQDKSYRHYQQSAAYYEAIGDNVNARYAKMNSSIAMTGMQYEKKPQLSVYDVLFNSGFSSKEHIDFTNTAATESRIDEYRKQLKRTRTIEVIEASDDNKFNVAGDSDDQYLFYTVLGCYFQDLRKKENIELAQRFFNAAIIVALLAKPFDYEKIHSSLKTLSWVYGYTREKQDALRLSNLAIDLALRQKDPKQIVESYISKGNTQNIMGDYKDGLKNVRQGLALVETMTPNAVDMNHAKEYGFRVLGYLFKNTQNKDSLNYYKNEYELLQSLYLDELHNMSEVEGSLAESINDRELSDMMKIIDSATTQIQQKEQELGTLTDRYSLLGVALEGKTIELQDKVIKIGKQDSIISTQVNKLNGLTTKIKQSEVKLSQQQALILENEKTIQRQKKQVYTSLIVIVLLSLGVFFIVVIVRNRLRKVRIELNALAQNKMHNIQNNYSSMYKILKEGDLKKGRLYSNSSSYFFSLLASKDDYEKNNWSIADELEVLNAFLMREEILGKKVVLEEPEISQDIDIVRTSFPPEVLTTIVHNSIRHGFKDIDYTPRVRIKITKTGKLLNVSVIDNGKPSKTYIRKERPKSGLSLLRKRVLNEFIVHPQYLFTAEKFSIIPVTNEGTTIKFKFPHAKKSTNAHR